VGFDEINVLEVTVQNAATILADRLNLLTARYCTAQSDEERRNIIFETVCLSARISMLAIGHTVASRHLVNFATRL